MLKGDRVTLRAMRREDLERYFEPIALTDRQGQPAEWLKPYLPAPKRKGRPVAALAASTSSR